MRIRAATRVLLVAGAMVAFGAENAEAAGHDPAAIHRGHLLRDSADRGGPGFGVERFEALDGFDH